MTRLRFRLAGGTAVAALIAALALAALGPGRPARAQPKPSAPAATLDLSVPGFWDPRRRPERPDLTRISQIRFLTDNDYPPFDFPGPDGNPAGFNVDLARMICEELKVNCTIQARRFDTLIGALGDNHGDAVIASLAPFVARRDSKLDDIAPERLEGRKIAVAAGTAHEAYAKTFFTEAETKSYPTPEAAREALRRGEVDLLFGDGIQLAFWLNGTDSANCCEFRGGPFTESRYFGEGVGIAVRRGNDTLRQAFNWALFGLWEKGRYTDLWLRYFPISPF
jgi:polar amino acid transport system substrate-binding protein